LPAAVAYFSTKNQCSDSHAMEAFANAVDPRSGRQVEWEDIKDLFDPSVSFSKKLHVEMKLNGDEMLFSASSEEASFSGNALRSRVAEFSSIAGRLMSWTEFKAHVSTLSRSGNIFRGQQRNWSLCTSFHRKGRFRIEKFVNADVKQLYQRISGVTPHLFDLSLPDHNGAFFNLLQHHGYPTPLLDWTYSPYVAAFFAFRGWPIGYAGQEFARIYVFSMKEWASRYAQIQMLNPVFPHLSLAEFLSINNPRLVPQQSLTTATNIHDIETYVMKKQEESGVEFLYAIDIPAREREDVMGDLRFMGITAGSMFPGVDGICEELREKNFD
jgi:hypothetical protein